MKTSTITVSSPMEMQPGTRLKIYGMGAYKVLSSRLDCVTVRPWRWYDYAWVRGVLGALIILAALLAVLALTACNLEEALDNSEPEAVKQCAVDSAQVADTLHFVDCRPDPRPTSPPGGLPVATLGNGGEE